MSTRLSLYEIGDQYRALAEQITDEAGDDPEVIRDTLESISAPLTEKAVGIAQVVRNMETTADAIEDAAAHMLTRAKSLRKRADNVRTYIKGAMELAGITRVESPLFTVRIQNNPPSVEVFDTAQLPEEFWRVPEPPQPQPDKRAIGDALRFGRTVPGAGLRDSSRLVIK